MVGIGGVGMSGIAELLVTLGYDVSGSDMAGSMAMDRLRAVGAHVMVGHDARHVGRPDVVVVSSAVPGDNPELAEAAPHEDKTLNFPYPLPSKKHSLAVRKRLRCNQPAKLLR